MRKFVYGFYPYDRLYTASFFVMENVKGIMSSPLKHVPLSERDESDPDQKLGTVLDVILSEFGKLGYKTVYGVLDAVNYGVPQFRERFVLIGKP